MTSSPYPISGRVKDTDGTTNLANVVVSLRNVRTGEDISNATLVVTDATGEYSIDPSNTTNGYLNGDPIEVYFYSAGSTTKFQLYKTLVNTANGSEEYNPTVTLLSYSSPSAIEELLQLQQGFTMTTPTNIVRICRAIANAEDDIDQKCNHAWREATVTEEIKTPHADYDRDTGREVFLKHRKVREMDTAEGDMIEMWDGGDWEDWVTSRTEGRGGDFWFDYELGILYVMTPFLISGKNAELRLTYRYGETTVPGDIKRLCARMVSIEFLSGEDRSAMLTGGEVSNMNHSSKIRKWQEDIDTILADKADISGASTI